MSNSDFRLVSESKVGFIISGEVPNKDTVVGTNTDDLLGVGWVEHDTVDGVVVAYESLEIVRSCFLSFVVPNFNHVVVSSGEEISRIV